MLRLLDEITEHLLSGFVVERNGQYVNVSRIVYATPERAFSGDDTKRIDLPVVSFYRVSQEFGTEFHSFGLQDTGVFYRDPANYQTTLSGVRYKLLPVRVFYQVDFWVKFMDDMQLLQTQLLHYFRPVLRRYMKLPSGGGVPLDYVLQGMVDNSDLEPGEDERVLRFSADLSVEGYLPLGDFTIKLIRDTVIILESL